MRIAVDCMGGDYAPSEIVKGALKASNENCIKIVLIGDQNQIEKVLDANTANIPNIEIVHAPEVITNEDSPAIAIRRKKRSSIVTAAEMLKIGQVDALLTAGSTGAFLAAGLLIVGRLATIRRPALAPVIPNQHGLGPVLLDVGANMDATVEDLTNYAVMGSLYAEHLLNRVNPKVALLNVGVENKKGSRIVKEAFKQLQTLDINFMGNIESRTLPNTDADVVVCDGFVGNVALKLMEGMASSLFATLKQEFINGTRNKVGAYLLKPSLRAIKQKLDYNEYGGAPLLGLNGLCIKCHGSSKEQAIASGVRQTVRLLESDIVTTIGASFS